MSETVFTQVNYNLDALVNQIELGQIGLPNIQRPFVWKDSKVRDLFDSMYRGYPVGYLLLWQSSADRTIGPDKKQMPSQLLIVDGQQRLTALYAVFKGVPVIRENYEAEKISIAFNPLEERFEVSDAAIQRINRLFRIFLAFGVAALIYSRSRVTTSLDCSHREKSVMKRLRKFRMP